MPGSKPVSEKGPVKEAASQTVSDVATPEEGNTSASDPAAVDCIVVNGLNLEIVEEGEIRRTGQLYVDVIRQSGMGQRVWIHEEAPPYERVHAAPARVVDLYNVAGDGQGGRR